MVCSNMGRNGPTTGHLKWLRDRQVASGIHVEHGNRPFQGDMAQSLLRDSTENARADLFGIA